MESEELAALQKKVEQGISESLKEHNFDEILRLARMAKDLETAIRTLKATVSQVANGLTPNRLRSPGEDRPKPGTGGVPELDALSNKAKGNRLREEWLRGAKERGIRLHRFKGVIYETESGKRVGIPSATEVQPSKWWLGLPDEHFDFLVLLCKPKAGQVLDFVLPSELVDKVWPLLSRHGDYKKIHVQQSGVNYKLEPGAGFFAINEYRSKIEVLQ